MTTKSILGRRLASPGVALAEPIVPTRFSTPIATRFTQTCLRQTRSGSLPDGQLGLFNEAEADAPDEPAPTTDVSAHRRASGNGTRSAQQNCSGNLSAGCGLAARRDSGGAERRRCQRGGMTALELGARNRRAAI